MLLHDSCRHTNLLQNGYEIFLVIRSGREGRDKDFLTPVKNRKKNLLVKNFSRNCLWLFGDQLLFARMFVSVILESEMNKAVFWKGSPL